MGLRVETYQSDSCHYVCEMAGTIFKEGQLSLIVSSVLIRNMVFQGLCHEGKSTH